MAMQLSSRNGSKSSGNKSSRSKGSSGVFQLPSRVGSSHSTGENRVLPSRVNGINKPIAKSSLHPERPVSTEKVNAAYRDALKDSLKSDTIKTPFGKSNTGSYDYGGEVPRYGPYTGSVPIKEIKNPTGRLKAFYGAKLFPDGKVRYPDGVPVAYDRWAKDQAWTDYSYSSAGDEADSPLHRQGLGEVYDNTFRDYANGIGGKNTYGNAGMSAGDVLAAINAQGTQGAGNTPTNYPKTSATAPITKGVPWENHTKPIPNTGRIRDNAYEAYAERANREQLENLNRQTDAAVSNVAAQQGDINHMAERAAREAYTQMLLTQGELPQQLSAMGQSGGASESALLGLNTTFENQRGDILQNRDKAIQQNLQQQNDIRLSGDTSIANAENAYYTLLAEKQWQAEQAAQQRQWQQQQGDLDWQRKLELLEKEQQYKAANSGGGSGKPRLTYQQSRDEWNRGNRTPEVVAAYEYYVGSMPQTPGIQKTMSENAFESWTPDGKASQIKYWHDMGYSDEQIFNQLIPTMGW